ncbi:MAG: NnrU family protein [Pseudomonadota bacterium]|nr:NnrU family protein [Pseudomonadota bacterium]
MVLMIAGLALFLGIHLVPASRPVRDALTQGLSDRRYKALFSALSAIGLVLIVLGYRLAGPSDRLFAPLPAARAAAPFIVTAAFVLLAASHMRGHIRRVLQHPMIIGILLWSGVHLLANGDRRGTYLFGGFVAWAIVDLVAALRRGPAAPFEAHVRYDLMAIVGGLIVAGIVVALHQPLFGVRPV